MEKKKEERKRHHLHIIVNDHRLRWSCGRCWCWCSGGCSSRWRRRRSSTFDRHLHVLPVLTFVHHQRYQGTHCDVLWSIRFLEHNVWSAAESWLPWLWVCINYIKHIRATNCENTNMPTTSGVRRIDVTLSEPWHFWNTVFVSIVETVTDNIHCVSVRTM